MSDVLFSMAAFIVALGVLVTVHEFGHFWVARRVGVKVLRFSVGFGKPLWRRMGADDTEYVIAALPLGGYVKMLDEHEGEVAPNLLSRAFNRKPLGARVAVVIAGPLFNIVFAILAYWLIFVTGVTGTRPVIGAVIPDSPAAAAGLVTGDEITAVDGDATPTWDTALTALLNAALKNSTIDLEVNTGGHPAERRLHLPETGLLDQELDLPAAIGIKFWRPTGPALIDTVEPGGAADRAGLQSGDLVIAADAQPVPDWDAWVAMVRNHPDERLDIEIERGGERMHLALTPDRQEDGTGRIGASWRLPQTELDSMRTEYRLGPLEAVPAALWKTWDMASMTLRVLARMVIGEASVKNLSGPLSIAQYAGHSASIGLAAFLSFLAIVSISLGILNLLPIPLLDGGHLLYYLIEFVTGAPVSERVLQLGQIVGIAFLLSLMGLAFYNDLTRLFG